MTLTQSLPFTIDLVNQPDDWARLLDHLGGHLLQSWQWGAFKARHGWSPVRLLVSRGGEPVAAAQILFRRLGPFSVGYVPRGPAVARSVSGLDVSSALTPALDHISKRRRAVILFVEPDAPAAWLSGDDQFTWQPSPAVFQPQRTIKIRVDLPDDELLARMRPKTRYNVRLAQRRGVTTRVGSIEEIPVFHRLLEETGTRDEFGIHGVEYYQHVLEGFGADATLFVAEYGGEAAAAILVVRNAREAIYMYGASTARHQRHMPTYLLQFEAMRWARDNGCPVYDLWGIPETDSPPENLGESNSTINVRSGLWGVYRFKQGFGGEVVSYPGVYERAYQKMLVRLWRRLRPGQA